MGNRAILAVGLELAHADVVHASFISNASLLDADVVLFRPDITHLTRSSATYRGKPRLDEDDSAAMIQACAHWQREIAQALKAGKTIVAFMCAWEEIYVDTGERRYSGTGKNRATTTVVKEFDNYKSIPLDISPTKASGQSMKLSPQCPDDIAAFWHEFKDEFEYHVVFAAPMNSPVLTRTGDRPVSAICVDDGSGGTLLLLPDIDFRSEEFTELRAKEEVWTDAAVQFAARMVSAVVSLDDARKSDGASTVEPEWALTSTYELHKEAVLREQLRTADVELEATRKKRDQIQLDLKAAGKLRRLLFEKGRPLENAILEALRGIGFNAEPFRNATSEFDVVFESAEGRLIGEVEGKDNKSINIDKLRQLSMNVHEDLQRDEVQAPAKPVLFGNGFRLVPIAERGEPFTKKCVEAATSSSTALVCTADLFVAARHLANGFDPDFAQRCRQAILSSVGRVVFPVPPIK